MDKVLFIFLLAVNTCCLSGYAKMQTDTFTFRFEGRRYSGEIDKPAENVAKAIIVIVPGYGKTNMVGGKDWKGLRNLFAEQGYACVVWDKAGCGKSEGVFDINQPVQNSASEVLAALAELKSRNIPGSEKIGLWGISRAGWICPLVIAQYPIAFWISVSGTDDKENFGYLLEKNFLIEGRTKAQTEMLMNEWRKGIEIARTGGTFEENLKATENLRKDSFYMYITNNYMPIKDGYLKWQEGIKSGKYTYEEKTELFIYVHGFDTILSKINCPVLAIFGEKDANVDWRKTKALYEKTIGKNPAGLLTIKTFPNGDHGLLECKTGGIREDLRNSDFCPGFYRTMTTWLNNLLEKGQ